VAHVACRDHGLDFAPKDFLESSDQVDLEFVCIFEDLRVEQDLVGFAEAEIELVLVEQFFVRLENCQLRDGDACSAFTYLGPLELHDDVWWKSLRGECRWLT
jgi:hypothetical protein